MMFKNKFELYIDSKDFEITHPKKIRVTFIIKVPDLMVRYWHD